MRILTAPIRHGRSIRWLLCLCIAFQIWSSGWVLSSEPDELATIPARVIHRSHPD